MRIILLIVIIISCMVGQAQQTPFKHWMKLSGGHIALGTRDLLGYSVALEYSRNLVKKPKWGKDKLLLGAEFIFESAVEEIPGPPRVFPGGFSIDINSYGQVASSLVWAKASYYPIHKILNGFHISLGPTAGYSQRTYEESGRIFVDPLGNPTYLVKLAADNGFTIGYRISTGLEFPIRKRYLIGARLDWSNNQEAEINTLLGVRLGMAF